MNAFMILWRPQLAEEFEVRGIHEEKMDEAAEHELFREFLFFKVAVQ